MTNKSIDEPYSIKEPGESNSKEAISEISNSATAANELGISASSTLISRGPSYLG